MKVVIIALAILFILIASSLGYASASPVTAPVFSSFNTSQNGLSDFSVIINDRSIEVFKYFNVSGALPGLNSFFINQDRLTPIYWQGIGDISVVPAINFSKVGKFSYSSESVSYVFLYNGSYLGILYSTGLISESSGSISISNSLTLNASIEVSYITSPISYSGNSEGNYTITGQTFTGTYTSFSYAGGNILNYSLIGRNSSLNVFTSIGGSNSNDTAMAPSISSLSIPSRVSLYASDSVSPSLYASGIGSDLNISLASGFSLVPSGRHHYALPPKRQNDPFSSMLNQAYSEHTFKLRIGHINIGYVDVYGHPMMTPSGFELDSPISFLVVHVLPVYQSKLGSLPVAFDKSIGNATLEIYVHHKPYFIPLSPNVTSLNLSYSGNTLQFTFAQNGSQYVLVVMQGNYSVSKFSISGVGSAAANHYTLKRVGNETFILFTVNGTGTGSLTLGVVPYTNPFPRTILGIFSTAGVLVVLVAIFGITYARRKFVKEFEKE